MADRTSRTGNLPTLCVPIIVVNAGENKEKIFIHYRAKGRERPRFTANENFGQRAPIAYIRLVLCSGGLFIFI
jgi:hypothetical protein